MIVDGELYHLEFIGWIVEYDGIIAMIFNSLELFEGESTGISIGFMINMLDFWTGRIDDAIVMSNVIVISVKSVSFLVLPDILSNLPNLFVFLLVVGSSLFLVSQ